jgi:hypothetical protein
VDFLLSYFRKIANRNAVKTLVAAAANIIEPQKPEQLSRP